MGGTFDPVHSAHAIERVSAMVVFHENIDGVEWLPVFKALEACASNLGLPKYVDGFQFMPASLTGPEGNGYPTVGLSIINAAKFARVNEDGVEAVSILANRSGVQLETQRYIRWNGFAEVLSALIRDVASAYPDRCLIYQVRLEYFDRFVENAPTLPRAPWSEVLRDGDLISTSHIARLGAWHMHTGWFEDSPNNVKLVLNLHVDATTESIEAPTKLREVGIRCMTATVTTGDVARDADAIMATFNQLHVRSKVAVRSTLTTEMQRRISIDVEESVG